MKSTSYKHLQLDICNPFTKQIRNLPLLHIVRANPALGLIELGPSQNIGLPHFRVYAAGGMSGDHASYEPTLELYDSEQDAWTMMGSMPVEFAVRLTVWTPNESVYVKGVLYWITSARAYSIMGFEIGPNKWKELSVPLADRLELATLVPRNGKLTLVGGESGGDVCIWELCERDEWSMIERMPLKLRMKFLGGKSKSSWGCSKCVGIEGAVCLYRDLWSGVVVWRQAVKKGRWEWSWIPGCYTMIMDNCPIKGLLLHPNLSPSLLDM